MLYGDPKTCNIESLIQVMQELADKKGKFILSSNFSGSKYVLGNSVTPDWNLRVGFPTTRRQPTRRKDKTFKPFCLLTVFLPQGCFRKDKETTIPIFVPYLAHITTKTPNDSRRSCLFNDLSVENFFIRTALRSSPTKASLE